MRTRGKELSIKYSMVKRMILYVLIPLFAALAVLCAILERTLSSGTSEAFQMMFDQNLQKIDNSILQSNYASSTMVSYTENNRLLRSYYEAKNPYERNNATAQIEKMILNSEITILGSFQGEMALLMNDGRLIDSSNAVDIPESRERYPWLSRIKDSGLKPYWDNEINDLFESDGHREYVAFGRTLLRYQDQAQGYAFVRIPREVFSNFGEDPRFSVGTVAMYDLDGQLLTGPDERFSGEELEAVYDHWKRTGEARGRYKGLYYMASRLAYSGNTVIYTAGYHDVFIRSEQITVTIAVFMLLITVALVRVILSISKYITDPILFFAGRVALLEQNQPELITLDNPHFVEIRALQDGLLRAQKRIMSLIEEVRREAVMKEKARFDALAAQITPHFLFNTLNAIRWKAAMNQDQEVADILSELGVLLGEMYNKTEELEPVSSAMRTLEAYVQIMKVRFGDKTQFFFVIPEEMGEYMIPRFCLQPLVENSFIHGMARAESGVIALRGEMDGGDLVLTLIDNGPGIQGKQITFEEADGEKKRGVTGIGLSNIHSRIQALFGKGYGLQIDTELKTGFKISLRIPAIKPEDGCGREPHRREGENE